MSGNKDIDALVGLITQATTAAVAEYLKHGVDVPSLSSPTVHPLDSAVDVLELRKALRQLEGACNHLCDMLQPPASSVAKRTLRADPTLMHVASEGCIADILEDNPNGLHISNIAEATKLPAHKLRHVLRTLATRNCFQEIDTDVYANNRISYALRTRSETRARYYTWLCAGENTFSTIMYPDYLRDPEFGPSMTLEKAPWTYAHRRIGTKEDFRETMWSWYGANPIMQENFNLCMIGRQNADANLCILHGLPWNPETSLCDIGSGIGSFSLDFLKVYPDTRITLHDFPEVLDDARKVWTQEHPIAIAQGKIEFAPMDFLKEPPSAGHDVYFMRCVAHDWPDEDLRTILSNVKQAMSPKSRLIIQEYMLGQMSHQAASRYSVQYGLEQAPEPLLPNFGWGGARKYDMDFLMHSFYNAKERTVDELVALGESAGLRFVKYWDLTDTSALEFEVANEA